MTQKEESRIIELCTQKALQEAVLQETVKEAIRELGINAFLEQPELMPFRVLTVTRNLKAIDDELRELSAKQFKERYAKTKEMAKESEAMEFVPLPLGEKEE